MVDIQRQRILWSGFIGSPGVSTLYFEDAAAAQTPLHAMLDNLKSYLPTDVHMQMETSGDIINPVTGALTGAWAGSSSTAVVGIQSTGYSAPTGFQTRWETDNIINGHRVKGRTYWVPATGILFDTDGSLTSAGLAGIQAEAAAFVTSTAANFLVWVRPRAAVPTWTDKRGRVHPAIVAADGGLAHVTSGVAVDRAVVLTSRRG